jgi:hypothetical protein
VFGAQALQCPFPSHVPPGHTAPAASATTPHVAFVHEAVRHGFGLAGQSPATTHCTHFVVPGSHTGVCAGQLAGGSYWPFALHVRSCSPLHTFVPGWQTSHTPLPSHVPPLPHFAPATTGTKPQVCATEHCAAMQSFAEAGQSAALAHSAHAPATQTGFGAPHGGCDSH